MSRSPHLSVPSGREGPGVLLLHQARGLTSDIVWAGDRLAASGFVVFAPDLTDEMGSKVGAVRQLLAGRGPLIDGAVTALDELGERSEVRSPGHVGVVGFGMGASLGLLIAGDRRIGAIGFNYGIVPKSAPDDVAAPIVAAFGSRDRLLTRGGDPLRRHFAASETAVDIELFEGVGHSFMTHVRRPDSRLARRLLAIGYDSKAADLAWNRLVDHLESHLSAERELRG